MKWYAEHRDLEYTMDAANKTEKIAAPSGKHDDYCDSSVMGIHAALSMLPAGASIGGANTGGGRRTRPQSRRNYGNKAVLTTAARSHTLNKGIRF